MPSRLCPFRLTPWISIKRSRVIGSHADKDSLDRCVVAVTGAAGGSGATTVAVNLAYEIAEKLERATILAELTLQMGSLASMLDVHPRFTLPYLIREIQRVDDFLVEKTLVPVTDRLRILGGPQELNSMPSVDPDHLVKIVGLLEDAHGSDPDRHAGDV